MTDDELVGRFGDVKRDGLTGNRRHASRFASRFDYNLKIRSALTWRLYCRAVKNSHGGTSTRAGERARRLERAINNSEDPLPEG